MECARPFGDEGEGLGESLADDGTGFVREEDWSASGADVGIRFRRNEQRKIDFYVCSFLGSVFIRRGNEPISVVKFERNDNKNVRRSRNKYKEKSERTYFQYVPTIQTGLKK